MTAMRPRLVVAYLELLGDIAFGILAEVVLVCRVAEGVRPPRIGSRNTW